MLLQFNEMIRFKCYKNNITTVDSEGMNSSQFLTDTIVEDQLGQI